MNHPCPTIEWQILRDTASTEQMLGHTNERYDALDRARVIVKFLAESVDNEGLRRKFLSSKPVRDLLD
jgi:hypothetical protein